MGVGARTDNPLRDIVVLLSRERGRRLFGVLVQRKGCSRTVKASSRAVIIGAVAWIAGVNNAGVHLC